MLESALLVRILGKCSASRLGLFFIRERVKRARLGGVLPKIPPVTGFWALLGAVKHLVRAVSNVCHNPLAP